MSNTAGLHVRTFQGKLPEDDKLVGSCNRSLGSLMHMVDGSVIFQTSCRLWSGEFLESPNTKNISTKSPSHNISLIIIGLYFFIFFIITAGYGVWY